jgi:isopenicillin-N epimerase
LAGSRKGTHFKDEQTRGAVSGLFRPSSAAHFGWKQAPDVSSQRTRFWHCVQNKWLCAPPGSAFLYARREVQHLLEPLVVSWGWQDRPDRFEKPVRSLEEASEVFGPGGLLDLGVSTSRFLEENEWQGTRDPAAYLSVPASIQFQAEHNWPMVRAECHELLREARRRIEALTRLPPICPDTGRPGSHTRPGEGGNGIPPYEWFAQMAAFPLPACDAAVLQRRLYDESRVEVPIIEWNGRQLVRVSVQGYNTAEDVEALVTALTALLV